MLPHLTASPLELVAAFILGVIATARITRLVVHDDWPPMVWVRDRYRHAVDYGPWEDLVTCPFCFAPWAALVNLAWYWFAEGTDLAWTWWAANGWFAVAYLAAMLVARDEPPE